MTDLTRKYRPARFSDVVGQQDAAGWLRAQVVSKHFRSALISGPFGTGKTTLGLIYAKAALCAAPQEGEPCGVCDNCKAFGMDGRGVMDFLTFECGETSTVEDVANLLDFARTVPFMSDRRMILMDEAHNLSRRAFEALLRIFERPPKWTTFVILTSRVEALPAPLLSRLTHFHLSLLNREAAIDYLANVCAMEGLACDRGGLELLHNCIGGHARALLRGVEKASTYGAISETNVRLALNLNFLDRIASFCEALLANDFKKQLSLVDEWQDMASRKLDFLHRFFVFAYFNGVRRMARDDVLFQSMPGAALNGLVAGMNERAQRIGVDIHPFWESAIDALVAHERLSDYTLPLILTRFDRLVNGTPSPLPPALPPPPRARRLRAMRPTAAHASPQVAGEYASWKELLPLWEAASFMGQHYGVLFNLRGTVRLRGVSDVAHEHGAMIVADLTHEMGERLRDWCGGPVLHWIYRHQPEPDGRFASCVGFAVPPEQLEFTLDWARTRFFPRRQKRMSELEFSFAFCQSENTALRVRFHWRTVRALIRNLDPGLQERGRNGERRPLVELLSIPVAWRTPIGPVLRGRARGASQTLGPDAQREAAASNMHFLSAVKDRAWGHLDSGWELDEFVDRRAELARRRDDEYRLRALYPGDDELAQARRQRGLAELMETRSSDARMRLRSWRGWWQPPAKTPPKWGITSKASRRQVETITFSDRYKRLPIAEGDH